MMKRLNVLLLALFVILILSSCGVSGDPGHCFFSLNWEYYNDNYGVYYYEDDNPNVPEFEDIIADYNYDCYPGIYDFYYESEDLRNWYSYEGSYELIQNLGYRGGVFEEGLDGADTYFHLYLDIYAELGSAKSENPDIGDSVFHSQSEEVSRSGRPISGEPIEIINETWEETKGLWTLRVKQELKVYAK